MGAGLLLLALSSVGVLRPISDASYAVLSPIEDALRAVAQPIADMVTNYQDIRGLTRANERLRTENERLTAEIARLREEAMRQQQLERLLEVKSDIPTHEFLAVRVVARQPSNLRQIVAIDRGKGDGIKVGMPVVTEGNAFVGTVTKVEGNHSWVTLITDVDSAVSGLILESRAQGVVVGGYSKRLSMEFVGQDATVKEGDTVISSGVGAGHPAGLVIGRVTGVAGDRQEVFRRVTVEPLASLSRLENLLVMTSFAPTQVLPP